MVSHFNEEESKTIPISFEAIASENNAWIEVSSNDTTTGTIPVTLSGRAQIPELSVIPNPMDMGNIAVGCDSEQSLILSNTGDALLSISAITDIASDSFSYVFAQTLPIDLAPAEFLTLPIQFTPTSLDFHQYELLFTSNSTPTVNTVSLYGTGISEPQEDLWEIDSAPQSDILFAVDLSSSMSDEALVLGQQFSTFISTLSTYTSDWQAMVVNADHGCNHSGILTPNTTGYEEIFSEAVRTGAYDISFTEALLTNVTRAVEKSGSGECNEGFLRPNTMLHIIMLSDECEQSPNPGICGTQWQSYVDRIVAAKGDANLVRISAVAGDYPSGCGTPQTAEFGSGYWESTVATGGVFLSICSDWTSPLSLQQLASTSISQNRFALSAPPITESIDVWVDGIMHSDWSFDESSNEVIFLSSPASSGSEVRISYYIQPTCEQ